MKEKHLWAYVLFLWNLIAIIVSAMYHKRGLLTLFRRNTMELPVRRNTMELSVRYDARDEYSKEPPTKTSYQINVCGDAKVNPTERQEIVLHYEYF
ncbi:hypothetical protein CDAR_506951 [Caerostris darwini]|uniref:Uncharacterized protein n=1 Tax=Caerostris darwini TaxID=1538125 RepID=A0AAV4TD41_9ARAC|nr:hypothetical protein CDAR_506951 [Caerostris darwini]